MVPCLFLSRPSKRQLHVCMRACGVFRNKTTIVEGSCLRADREYRSLGNGKRVKFCQKLGKSATETFQTIKQRTAKTHWSVMLCLSGTNVLLRVEIV
jgi:hypothetical protein